MTYDSILARSFSRHEQKKLGYGAFLACLVMAFTFCLICKPHIGHKHDPLTPGLSVSSSLKMLVTMEERISKALLSYTQPRSAAKPILLNLTNSKSQAYEISGDVRIQGKSSTVFIASTQHQNTSYDFTTKPYARQGDRTAMGNVRSFIITNQAHDNRITPHCTRNLTEPAIVFSTGGYAGNHFHDFTDVLIPLYLTSRQFNRKVRFLVTDKHSWWISKYKSTLQNLSKYEVIDIDNNNEILCFSRVIVGLRAHKELSIDPSQSPHYSTPDFTKFLRSTYSLRRKSLHKSKSFTRHHRPRLLIISRKKTRRLTNEAEVADIARNLGFVVDMREMGWQVSKVAKFVNTFDVMVGVHGAGFTNMVFLPENAVVIQIVPIGVGFLSKAYFEVPAKDMNLRYLEYNVSCNESSLSEKYPVDSQVFTDAYGIHSKGWNGFRSIYLDNQDVNIDLGRFRTSLLKALELLSS